MIELNYAIDEEALATTINDAISLENNEDLFEQLTSVAKAKKDLLDAFEKLDKIDGIAKGFINAKAKELYGNDWQAIAGQHYKITKSPTGFVYIRNPEIKVNKKFIELKETILTKVVDEELEKTGKLPAGIEVNPSRGESIRIILK